MSEKKLVKMATAQLNADNEIEQVGYKTDSLLRKKGWSQTCSVPGSVWLWEKKLNDGRTALVNKTTAIHIQCWIDEYGEE